MSISDPDFSVGRTQLLVELFDQFKAAYSQNLQPSEELWMNYVQLYNVVESYKQDVERYKQYHFVDPVNALINQAKKSAFMVKWIVYIKPLYVHNSFAVLEDNPDRFRFDDLGMVINELFAIYISECLLGVQLTDGRFNELVYILRYRDPNEYVLMPLFQMILDARQNKAFILL